MPSRQTERNVWSTGTDKKENKQATSSEYLEVVHREVLMETTGLSERTWRPGRGGQRQGHPLRKHLLRGYGQRQYTHHPASPQQRRLTLSAFAFEEIHHEESWQVFRSSRFKHTPHRGLPTRLYCLRERVPESTRDVRGRAGRG